MTAKPSELAKNNALSEVRIVVRPYASSLPLGCFAFGIGNALIGAMAMHWILPAEKATLAVMMLAFVAPLELIPCAVAFLSRDTGAATAMGIFSAGWVVQGIQLRMSDPSLPSSATGIFLLLLALCLGILASLTFRGKPLLGTLLCVAILRSIGAAFGQFGIHGALDPITGVLDFLVALLAFYSGFALLLEDITNKPTRLTLRHADAKVAIEGTLAQQMEHISNEAGVRKQL